MIRNFQASSRCLISKLLTRGCTRIIIASPGRSGSTLLRDSIVDNNKYLRRIQSFNSDLNELSNTNSLLVKTHALPPNNNLNCKTVYIFDAPDKTVASWIKKAQEDPEWGNRHKVHLGLGGVAELSQRFMYEAYYQNVSHWMKYAALASNEVLFVHYDDLWQKTEIISKFLRLKLELPLKQERSSEVSEIMKTDNSSARTLALTIYDDLRKKYEA